MENAVPPAEPEGASAAPRTETCSQCATPVTIPAAETIARCPACGARVGGGPGVRFGMGWRIAIATNVGLMVAIGLALLVGLNWLGNRYFFRRDATFSKKYSLSDRTLKLLDHLATTKKRVQIYLIRAEMDGRTMQALDHTLRLLEEYQARCRDHVKYEALDYTMDDLKKVAETTKIPNIREIERNEVIFFCENNGKTKRLQFTDLYEAPSQPMGEEPSEGGEYKFKGDSTLASGIESVIDDTPTKVYYVTGHGEYGKDDWNMFGISQFDHRIKSRENYETAELNLASTLNVPADASAILIVRPRMPFAPNEMEALRKYLDGGGRALILLNPTPEVYEGDVAKIDDLIAWLENWGIQVGKDVAAELSQEHTTQLVGIGLGGEGMGRSTGPMMFNVTEYGYHEITGTMQGIGTWFFAARSVSRAPRPPEGITVTELAKTTAEGLAVPEDKAGGNVARSDCRPGPISVAVCAEKPGTDPAAPKTRIVVIGDADGINNDTHRKGAMSELAINSLRWLVNKGFLNTADPVVEDHPKLRVPAGKDRRVLLALSVFLMPVTFLCLGAVVWILRRK